MGRLPGWVESELVRWVDSARWVDRDFDVHSSRAAIVVGGVKVQRAAKGHGGSMFVLATGVGKVCTRRDRAQK